MWQGRIVRESGIDRYTLLYLKLITNKDLLHSPGNSALYYIIIGLGKESEEECIYVSV